MTFWPGTRCAPAPSSNTKYVIVWVGSFFDPQPDSAPTASSGTASSPTASRAVSRHAISTTSPDSAPSIAEGSPHPRPAGSGDLPAMVRARYPRCQKSRLPTAHGTGKNCTGKNSDTGKPGEHSGRQPVRERDRDEYGFHSLARRIPLDQSRLRVAVAVRDEHDERGHVPDADGRVAAQHPAVLDGRLQRARRHRRGHQPGRAQRVAVPGRPAGGT